MSIYIYWLHAHFSSKNVHFHPSRKINNDTSSESRRIYPPVFFVDIVIVVGCLKIPSKKTTTNTFSKTKFIAAQTSPSTASLESTFERRVCLSGSDADSDADAASARRVSFNCSATTRPSPGAAKISWNFKYMCTCVCVYGVWCVAACVLEYCRSHGSWWLPGTGLCLIEPTEPNRTEQNYPQKIDYHICIFIVLAYKFYTFNYRNAFVYKKLEMPSLH